MAYGQTGFIYAFFMPLSQAFMIQPGGSINSKVKEVLKKLT